MPALHFNGNNLKFRLDDHAYLDFIGLKTGPQGVKTFDTTATGQHRCTGSIKQLIGRNCEEDPALITYTFTEDVIFKDNTLVEITGPGNQSSLLLKGRDENDEDVTVRTGKGQSAHDLPQISSETLGNCNITEAAPGSYPQHQSVPAGFHDQLMRSSAGLSTSPPSGGVFVQLQQLAPSSWFGDRVRLFISWVCGTWMPEYRRRSTCLIRHCQLIATALKGTKPDDEVKRAFDAAAQAMKVACENPPRDQETIERLFQAAETFTRACLLVLEITPPGGVDQELERDINEAIRRGETLSDIFAKLVHQLNVVVQSEDPSLSDASAVASQVVKEAHVRHNARSIRGTAAREPNKHKSWTIRVFLYRDNLLKEAACKEYIFEDPHTCRVGSLIPMVIDPIDGITEYSDHMNFYIPEKRRHMHTDDGLALKQLTAGMSLLGIPNPEPLAGPTVWLIQSSVPYIIITIGTATSMGSGDRPYLVRGYIQQQLREPLRAYLSGTYRNLAGDQAHEISHEDALTWGELPAGDVIQYSSQWLLIVD